jgi:hypothetical protein
LREKKKKKGFITELSRDVSRWCLACGVAVLADGRTKRKRWGEGREEVREGRKGAVI